VTERVDEPPPPRTMHEPVDLEREIAHKNNVLAVAFFGLFVLLFAGTFVIAFVYLAFS
jgi:hypothetical protein